MPNLPVVRIVFRDGRVWLETSDYELYGHLEDFFVEESDIEVQPVHLTNESSPRYSLILPPETRPESVVTAITLLLADEPEPTFEYDASAVGL